MMYTSWEGGVIDTHNKQIFDLQRQNFVFETPWEYAV